MATVFDVAKYILQQRGPMTTMKLQKLVYYCQAWSLVWDEEPLFEEKILAWVNGPVVRELYEKHRGKLNLAPDWEGLRDADAEELTGSEKETIDKVLEFYGDKTAQWLSDLTHKERPWREARRGMADTEYSEAEISTASMHEYYSGLPDNPAVQDG